MTWQGWYTLGIVALMVSGLVRYAHAADVIFLGALMMLTVAGIVGPDEALAGFHNEGMLTVAALFVVAAGLVETGLLARVTRRLLGGVQTGAVALRRVVLPVIGGSAFLNNTTVVAMMMPALLEWSRKRRVAPSRLLLPLSYASVLGGLLTLIGTSTNLLVHGLMKQSGVPELATGLGMWELAWIGLPIAAVGALYLIFLAPRLLPDRKEFLEQLGESRREYMVEVRVEPACPLVGRTVQDAGLRGLPGLFLIEIDRGGNVISPVGPNEPLSAGDRLVFAGVVSTIVDLQKTPGLVPVEKASDSLGPDQQLARRMCEAVISTSSPLVGLGIREANFRSRYDAVVIAVHRSGRRLKQKIGDIRLQSGDTLLLQAGSGFVAAQRNNPDFYLVSEVSGAGPVRYHRALRAGLIAGAMLAAMTMPDLLSAFGAREAAAWFNDRRVIFAILAAGLMVVSRCISASQARRTIEWNVLIVIASAIGLGQAMINSGAAHVIAERLIDGLFGGGAVTLLLGIFLLTWLVAATVNHAAAAAIMFPIAVQSAIAAGVDPRAFVITLTVAASSGFILPTGYQTHMMVFGPGGYRVRDFVKAGLPMVLIWLVLAILVIPRVWL
ncbi:MAG: SLC13 family permease [Phycisphaerae bacterium]